MVVSQEMEQLKELPPLEEGEVFLKGKNPFGYDIELKGRHIEEVDTFVFKPDGSKMIIEDGQLVLSISAGDGPFFAFRYPELTYLKTVGTRGNGPDEFVFPLVLKSHDPAYLCYFYDIGRCNLYGLDTQNEIHFVKKLFETDSPFGVTQNLYNVDAHTFLYAKNAITRISIEADVVHTKDIYPLQLRNARGMPSTGALGVNPEQNRMVYAYKYAKIVKFMDLEAQTVRTLNFQQSTFDEKTLSMADGLDRNVTHYMDVIPTPDAVYITYSGRSPIAVYNELKKDIYYSYVEKYDWNGNPLCRYKLDAFSICCAYDKQQNQLVLCCHYYDDPFVVFELE